MSRASAVATAEHTSEQHEVSDRFIAYAFMLGGTALAGAGFIESLKHAGTGVLAMVSGFGLAMVGLKARQTENETH